MITIHLPSVPQPDTVTSIACSVFSTVHGSIVDDVMDMLACSASECSQWNAVVYASMAALSNTRGVACVFARSASEFT